MAQDVITLLDFLGWKDPRSIHVIGVSLGGMISQGVCPPYTYNLLLKRGVG